ncbi:MAG: ribose-5-phosphate isomerase [Candidatus Wildermuthbacteria bacterium RIFCSPLOWO2_01_FULL_48_16]|uniref:Ribose-5-phosphate isomerase n=1 Tax=Candidatus Wildermuthbacteria bacterium RIFCSPLOWO2_01_FULL_48_16 TaxID=1802461 RepID=A0A1G2RJL7_9BACT|nr:MAG: ribose-5-phosphate isomerase [Candidatus Wildermuthbacteria bacterium RIFCSPHIGHO2_02_FULL_49_12b]OHA72718.1 MAG: ribose-5-phosphate isomerase [Candidatus Wildermuthbacteria bacterium RIFCSPLOWO2_01_FULL_48_16]
MIYLGADHAGFELKEEIKKYLLEQKKDVEDLGAFELNQEDDYPDFIIPVAKKVAENPEQNQGIVLGGSGQGEAIASNRFKGVRAAVYYGGDKEIVRLSRAHNNTNVLSLGARFLTKEQALDAVKLWLETPFEAGRHARRIQKIEETK